MTSGGSSFFVLRGSRWDDEKNRQRSLGVENLLLRLVDGGGAQQAPVTHGFMALQKGYPQALKVFISITLTHINSGAFAWSSHAVFTYKCFLLEISSCSCATAISRFVS